MNKKPRKTAFSLIETLVAMAVLSTSLIAILATLRSAASLSEITNQKIIAIHLAESILVEQLFSIDQSYKVINGQTDRFGWTSEIAKTSIEDLALINVTVNWQSQDSTQRVQLKTFKRIKPLIEQR